MVEDEILNGSTNSVEKPVYEKINPKLNLRDRIIDYVKTHEKATKGDIVINVSSSGTAQTIVTGLLESGIFIVKYFDCNSCVYFELDKTKVSII